MMEIRKILSEIKPVSAAAFDSSLTECYDFSNFRLAMKRRVCVQERSRELPDGERQYRMARRRWTLSHMAES